MVQQPSDRWCGGTLLTLAALLALASPAQAQEVGVSAAAEVPVETTWFAVGRAKALFLPDAVLGIWFDEHANLWGGDQRNFAYGFEFGWRPEDAGYELSLAVDWFDLTMPSQFWKEEGKPPEDAKFTQVDLKLLALTFASVWTWEPKRWLTPYLGAGIGAAIVLGDVMQYSALGQCRNRLGQGETPYNPPECFDAQGEPRADQIDLANPDDNSFVPVVPMIQAMGGVRFNIKDYGLIKAEVGFHNAMYVSLGAGVQW